MTADSAGGTAAQSTVGPIQPSDDEAAGLLELSAFRRPRLRPEVPIMWRSSSSIQIGSQVRITDVTRAHVSWMTSLDGMTSVATIEESLTIPLSVARRLVRALLAATALEDAGRVPINVRWAAPADRDAAQRRFSTALSTYREIDRTHDVLARRDRHRVHVRGEDHIAIEVRSALTAAGLSLDEEYADLIVLADAPHPDVASQVEIPALTTPHVHVATHAERATIGPLVVPGVTSCLRCRHLHRRDADPAWPLLAVQWAQALEDVASRPIDPLHARLAADWVALLVRTWIDLPEESDTWGNLAIDVTLPLGEVRVRECPPHPLCGCRWGEPPAW